MLLFQFRWQDFIDIFIVAFIIYRILIFFVDTRAAQLFRGLTIIATIGLAAKLLDFKILSWLLSHLLGAILIAIPILFQPELRRMLEEIGKGTLWGTPLAQDTSKKIADTVTSSLIYLAEKRIGAILVFQRDTSLKEIWQSAVFINAEITQELIISIFWPNNPLHDGAAILDRSHIIAAACYLPLTDKQDLSTWYGTRHRAAIGVTEISDAVALVVSEEQGKITLAVKGRLSRPLTEEQLNRFLRRYFDVQEHPKDIWEKIKQKLGNILKKGEQ